MTDWYKNSDTEYSTTWTIRDRMIVGTVWRPIDWWWWDVFITGSSNRAHLSGTATTKEAAMSAAERASVQL